MGGLGLKLLFLNHDAIRKNGRIDITDMWISQKAILKKPYP
jgi:hypothetical protein